MKKMRMRKATKDNMITYLMVAVLFIVMQGLSAGGVLSNQMQGLLVPLCVYIIAGDFPEPGRGDIRGAESGACRLHVPGSIFQRHVL